MNNTTQSPNWDDMLKLITERPATRIPGFPFNVTFPTMYGGQKYEIILVSGEKVEARVDDSREFYSEGLEWKTGQGNKSRSEVVAWKLIS